VKKIVKSGSVDFDGQGFETWGKEGDYLYFEILERIYEQMNAMLSHHSRIFVMRFDLHLDEYSQSNGVATRFFRRLVRQFKKQYSVKRVGYIWV